MYIGLRTHRYGPATTSFRGGSKGAGVPLPMNTNVRMDAIASAAPATMISIARICTSPIVAGRTMPAGARMRSGTNTSSNPMNSVAYVSARKSTIIYGTPTHDAPRTTYGRSRQLPHHVVVRLRPAVAEELPGAADLLDHVEVHLRDDELVFVLAALRQEIAARIDEIARAVELPHVPRRLDADAIDATHEVAVGHGMGRLLELPEILRESFHRRGGIEHDLRAVEAEESGAFRKVAIVADVHADRGEPRLENGIAQIARFEEELLPESGGVRNVILAVFAEVGAVRIDHRGRVVVDAGHLALVDRHDHRHLVLLGQLLHVLDRRARNRFGDVAPLRVLAGTEVGAVEDFLQAEDLDAFLPCFLYIRKVLFQHRVADLGDGRVGVIDRVRHLD